MSERDLSDKITELEELISLLKQITESRNRPANEIILDDIDLQKLMYVSKRKTKQWRDKGLIAFSKPSGKIYYRLSDILDMLDRARIPASENDMRNLLEEKKLPPKKKIERKRSREKPL